jgi:hypothetical protein
MQCDSFVDGGDFTRINQTLLNTDNPAARASDSLYADFLAASCDYDLTDARQVVRLVDDFADVRFLSVLRNFSERRYFYRLPNVRRSCCMVSCHVRELNTSWFHLNFFRSNHYSPFQFLRCVTIMRGYGE